MTRKEKLFKLSNAERKKVNDFGVNFVFKNIFFSFVDINCFGISSFLFMNFINVSAKQEKKRIKQKI